MYEAFSDDETIIRALCNYINPCKKFYDTSTVLIGELNRIGFVEDVTPATLSKKLRNHAGLLHDKFNIKIDFIRKSDKRILSICDSSDDNDSSIA